MSDTSKSTSPTASNTPSKPQSFPDLSDQITELVEAAGGDTKSLSGKLIREAVHTALKLIRDGADDGELKLFTRSFKELRYAMRVFRPYRDRPKVSIFGSARTPKEQPAYRAGVDFARALAEHNWMVITGAGGGIMEAGNQGAGAENSFGAAIRLPFETTANPVIEHDEKLINFRYFFTRKLIFVSQSQAIALLPGGFGTHDEGFEVLTLVQTGKSVTIPIVLLDEPGGHYWRGFDDLVKTHLLEQGLISPEDLSLYYMTDDPRDAARHVMNFYKNYHSQRYVHDDIVLRLNHALSADAVRELNAEFGDIVKTGEIEACDPLPGEHEFLDLPRLKFHFTRMSFGRLRMLIDRINELG